MADNTPSLELGIWQLVGQAGPVVKLVLILLVVASIACWAIVIFKYKYLGRAKRDNQKFLKSFWESRSLDQIYSKVDEFKDSPIAKVFKSGFKELQKLSVNERSTKDLHELENVNRALARASNYQMSRLEKHVSLLATTASASPFIGLFGTVWGIMNSFRKIGATGSANLAVVAPGISEALIATAIGLAAAIPAAIFYNYFVSLIQRQSIDVDCFTQDFLNIVQRGLMGGSKNQ